MLAQRPRKTRRLGFEPGDIVERPALHAEYGGHTSSRISPSPDGALVMVFLDRNASSAQTALTGWRDDGHFHLCGEGATGDHEPRRGNKAIRDHEANGRALLLFQSTGPGTTVLFLGRFRCVDGYETDAPDNDHHSMRTVLMFRLSPVDPVAPREGAAVRPFAMAARTEIALTDFIEGEADSQIDKLRPASAEELHRESLERRYAALLASRGANTLRLRIGLIGETTQLRTGLFDPEANLLLEASGSNSRQAITTALGRLLDGARFISPAPRKALILARAPRQDLRSFLDYYRIGLVIATDGGFEELLRTETEAL